MSAAQTQSLGKPRHRHHRLRPQPPRPLHLAVSSFAHFFRSASVHFRRFNSSFTIRSAYAVLLSADSFSSVRFRGVQSRLDGLYTVARPMNASTRERRGGIMTANAAAATECHAMKPATSIPLPRRPWCRFSCIAWIVAVLLVWPFVAGAGEEPGGKRVENRGAATDTAARPAGPKPGSAGSAPSEPNKECEIVQKVIVEETTTTEETQVVRIEEVVVLPSAPIPSEPTEVMTFEDVLLNTLGRRQVTTVVASTDARNPIPSYAFVGFQPAPISRGFSHTVRLQRFECELEAGAGWSPAHSVFTLAVGTALFQLNPDDSEFPRTFPVLDTFSGRIYPLAVGVSKRIAAPGVHRYRLSIYFRDAAHGHAPQLLPEDGVYLSVDPAPTAPPDFGAVKFVLVDGNEGAESTLRLVEKSGSAVSILPNLSRLELAAFCSVVHVLRR
jgi:hypothetical protein